MIKVRLTAQLKDWTKGVSEVDFDTPGDLQDALKKLEATFPGIGQRFLDDQGHLRAHVNVFVNNENARQLNKELTKLADGDVVHILPSVAGG